MPKAAQDCSAASSDRRGCPRTSFDLPLAVPVIVRSDLGVHRGIARNISEGGMLVELEEAPPIGSTLEVTIGGGYGRTGESEKVILTAEVRHQVAWSFIGPAGQDRLRGVGLRFVSMSAQTPEGAWLH